MAKTNKPQLDPDEHYRRHVAPHLELMLWTLRVTDHKDRPSPVIIAKYRKPLDEEGKKTRLVERGIIYGNALRRCLPAIRDILGRVRDANDHFLELDQYLAGRSIAFRGNLPLDDEAGAKLALLFRLQERVQDLDRVELMARRIDNFTEEEASYWLSRILHFGRASNRWAAAGMRIMLGGLPGDPEIPRMLQELNTLE